MEISLVIVSLVSLVVAVAMSVVAWRILRDERQRSSARVAALASDIHDDAVESRVASPSHVAVGDLLLTDAARPSPADRMFATAETSERSRLTLVAAVVALVVGAAIALTIVFSGPSDSTAAAGPAQSAEGHPVSVATNGAKTASGPAPLELVALGHERDSDGLTVRGVLRNPPTGAEVSHLSAVVLLFNRNGGYLASGRAAVQAATLGPGGETTFVVTVPDAPDVDRYRVSFRTDHDVVPHVDHRS
jgi:hypothetical protein